MKVKVCLDCWGVYSADFKACPVCHTEDHKTFELFYDTFTGWINSKEVEYAVGGTNL